MITGTKQAPYNWIKTASYSLLILICLILLSRVNYLLFHTLIELSSIVIGAGIFILAWHGRHYLDNSFFIIMGVALLFTSSLDLLHTLAYKGMGVFPKHDANLPTQLWIAARYLHSISLIAAVLLINWKTKINKPLWIYGTLTALLVWAIYTPGFFPVCFVEGQGLTPFKKISELIICAIFALALMFLFRQRERFSKRVCNLLMSSILFAIAAELSFIFYLSVYDTSNFVGHIFKLASFSCLYLGIIRTGLEEPLNMLFQELQQKDQQLEKVVYERTSELNQTITQLHTEIINHQQTEATLVETTLFLNESQSIGRIGGWKSNPATGMLSWTDELYRLFEHPEGEPLSHDGSSHYFDPEDRPQVMQALGNTLQAGTPFQLNCRIITSKGRRFWADFRCIGRLEGPDGPYIAGTLQDITEHKLIEELLTSAKEMAEAASRTKTELLGTISHELRTPLNGVIGGVQLLEMTELSEEQNEYLQMIKSSAGNELTLVNDLLDLAGLEASGAQITSEPFNLLENINLGIIPHRTALETRGLRLTTELPDNLNRVVIGDGQRLSQIVSNLLANAIKFTELGGITITAGTISVFSSGLQLRLLISDTGIGIASHDLERIFAPFVQADMSNTRKFGGTGLGLAICRRLTERMGGSIRVDSIPGKGSSFTLELPLQLSEEPLQTVTETAKLPVWNGPDLTVLIVEDNDANLKTAAGLVVKLGLKAIYAVDGKIALSHWLSGGIDVILMDIQMPVMDGLEATRFIRQKEQDSDKHTPIIALTAFAMAEDREQLLAKGFDGYVAKPFRLDKLADELMRVVVTPP